MTDKATLLALAERVEKADGADRELDCRIYAEMQEWRFIKVMHRQKEGHFYAFRTSDGDKTVLLAPFYTRSLDASMALVPERCWVRMDEWPRDFCAPTASVQPILEPKIASSCATGSTLPLALTAAALRAHASQK